MTKVTSSPALAALLASMREPDEVELFLRDLLTPSEREAIEERWAIVRLLASGLTQREVRDQLDVSIATVTRGSLQMQKSEGGFERALARAERLAEASSKRPARARGASARKAKRP
jgi:Trp operon repressor